MTKIIDSIAATGKTTLGKRPNVLDMDSKRYKYYWDEHFLLPAKARPKIAKHEQKHNPDWLQNYLNEIVRQSKNYEIIVIGMSEEIYRNREQYSKWFAENNFEYIVAIPEFDDLSEYLDEQEKRGRERGSSDEGVAFVRKHTPTWIESMQKMYELGYRKVTIKRGEFLEHALVREGIISGGGT